MQNRRPTIAPAGRERAARAVVRALFSRLTSGVVELVDPDGTTHPLGRQDPAAGPPLRARMTLHDWSLYPALLSGGTGGGRTYVEGRWDSDDLVSLVRIAARAMPSVDRVRTYGLPVLGPIQQTAWRLRANTRARSREHIAAHYDLGNTLFSRFLDETLMYSSAVFEHPDATLHEASVAKLDRICRKLDLGPDDHVLEIGTGWGGFALHAASRYGCRVTTTTISREQHDLARERVREAGLEDRVTILMQDYRDLRGEYDRLVSIEMIEAVGWVHLDTYFETCSRLLRHGGAMLLQAIVSSERAYRVERAASGFINHYIFPGGTLPSLAAIARSVGRRTDLREVHLEDITPHYARTLELWRENFLDAWDELRTLGYDERFKRMWELYLAYCEAGFTERRISDVQLMLAKPGFRAEPLHPLGELAGDRGYAVAE